MAQGVTRSGTCRAPRLEDPSDSSIDRRTLNTRWPPQPVPGAAARGAPHGRPHYQSPGPRSLGRPAMRAWRSRRPQWTLPRHLPYAPLLPHPIRCTTQLIRRFGAMRAGLRKDAAPADGPDQHFRRVRNSKAVGSCDVEVTSLTSGCSRLRLLAGGHGEHVSGSHAEHRSWTRCRCTCPPCRHRSSGCRSHSPVISATAICAEDSSTIAFFCA